MSPQQMPPQMELERRSFSTARSANQVAYTTQSRDLGAPALSMNAGMHQMRSQYMLAQQPGADQMGGASAMYGNALQGMPQIRARVPHYTQQQYQQQQQQQPYPGTGAYYSNDNAQHFASGDDLPEEAPRQRANDPQSQTEGEDGGDDGDPAGQEAV
jgi:hypothetical protein